MTPPLALALWSGGACHRDAPSPAPDEPPACPQAWDWTGTACEPRLPASQGTSVEAAVEPLDAGEIDEATQLALAERFQPALVFSGDQVWPVPVAYCARSGADLMVYAADDAGHEAGEVALSNDALADADWSTLPSDGLVYQLDCPGDNTGPGYEEATWLTEWQRVQGDDPAQAPFPPTQYAHLLWFNRAAGLLLIQYWSWYPFDKFANNHEGDWEHVNVVIDTSTAEPSLIDAHWFFHSWSLQAFERVSRVTDGDGGDHVVVFAGGCGEFDGWGGCYSGASYPWPGQYVSAALFVTEDSTTHARTLHPDVVQIQLLLEPDEALAPEVSWLPHEVYFGQWTVEANSNAVLAVGANEVATQPLFKGTWHMGLNNDPWLGEDDSTYTWFEPPAGWEMIYNPGHDSTVSPPGG